ncbi:excisionase family DNA binding protein [Anaerospora hongkongensis]|uniref:Excisionase family DNA binding protein n=1 Tax=Anaerospora hongkongensis TaxID=244830 RepID=A0A4V6NG65_9FIRM|nr:helix-turn-helix domain-containing protein [Anaerospora hongkongensis]TCL32209.1 excisionase family DNA binding protein [Anaerospora hongkongensis]
MHEGFFTVREAAKELGVSIRTIYRYIKAGYLSTERLRHVPHGGLLIPKCQIFKMKNGGQ